MRRDVQTQAAQTSKIKKANTQIKEISLAKNQDSEIALSEKKKKNRDCVTHI